MTSAVDVRPIPHLSFVIPVVERRGDLKMLYEEYSQQVAQLQMRAEFIFVVNDRHREALPDLKEIRRQSRDEVTLILLGGDFGESTALTVGLERARAELVVTLASYFQVEPSGLAGALQLIDQGADLVVGRRFPRTDSLVNRLQSKVFHGLVRMMTSSDFHDISCGFRVMKAEVAAELHVYGGLHRFIPILASRFGFRVVEVPIPQRHEDLSTRYYGAPVYIKRILDILTVFFLLKFTKKPLRFFGLLGLGFLAVGCAITGYLGIYRILGMGPIGDRPLLLLGVLLLVLGIQTLSIGLIGEIIIFTHARKIRDYRIAEIIGRSVESSVPAGEPTESGSKGRIPEETLPR